MEQPVKTPHTNRLDAGAIGRTPIAVQLGNCGSPSPRVTVAEERVLRLVSQAKTNKEVAAALGISPATVKRHIENILIKLGLRNRVEVAIFGLTVNGCPHQSAVGCALRRPETAGIKFLSAAD